MGRYFAIVRRRATAVGAGAVAGLLFLVAGVTMLAYPALSDAGATDASPYGCLNPRDAGTAGGPWLSAVAGLTSWQSPSGTVEANPSPQETQLATAVGSSLGAGFALTSAKAWSSGQCDTFWQVEFADAAGSTVEVLAFRTTAVLNDSFVINTWGMSSSTASDGMQLLSEDTDGYQDTAVTATPDGLVVIVVAQGANSEWLIAGWPTTTTSLPCPATTTIPCPTEPSAVPDPLTLSSVVSLDQSLAQDTAEYTSTTTTSSTSTTPDTSPPATVPTTAPPSADEQITNAYDTLFDLADPSVTAKEAVIQNGASLTAALTDALASPLSQAAVGASVSSITMLDSATCDQHGLPYPCASVVYDILGTGGATLLAGQAGFAVSSGGTWLVATTTICTLLGLFYSAEGKSGTPPGCESTVTTTTVVPGSAQDQIAMAYDTLFDLADRSVTAKEAVIQNGASLATALTEALASPLASSATGADVTSVFLFAAGTCGPVGLPDPCARVTYDVLGSGGAVLLAGQTGYAVSIGGSWLVATKTVCNLLDLFYSAEGRSGTPPGCGPTTDTSSTTTAVGASTSTSPSSTTTTAPPTSTTVAASAPSGAGGTTSSSAPIAASAGRIVTASSGSLAFTGPGAGVRSATTIGAALVLLGLLLLALVEAPRRLARRHSGREGPARGKRPSQTSVREACRDSGAFSGAAEVRMRWFLGR